MWCINCARYRYHFHHDNGEEVTGFLAGNPNCDKCLNGVDHYPNQHDNAAFKAFKEVTDA